MARFGQQVKAFKPSKDIEINWETWQGGWNNLFKPTELEDNELAQADNLMLIGKGVPTGRWGADLLEMKLQSWKWFPCKP